MKVFLSGPGLPLGAQLHQWPACTNVCGFLPLFLTQSWGWTYFTLVLCPRGLGCFFPTRELRTPYG